VVKLNKQHGEGKYFRELVNMNEKVEKEGKERRKDLNSAASFRKLGRMACAAERSEPCGTEFNMVSA